MVRAKYKVVFIHPNLGIGGAERLVLDVALALQEQNVQVSFITNHFNKKHCFEEMKNGQIPVHVNGYWIPGHICGLFHAFLAYFKMLYLCLMHLFFLKNEDVPDVYFIDQIPVAVPLLKRKFMKVIYYCHHPDLLQSAKGGVLKELYRFPINRFEEFATGLSDVILVNSFYTSQVFKQTFPSIKKRIRILYPTITPRLLRSLSHANNNKCLEMIPELAFACFESNTVFLSINRYHPDKNIELAMEALHYLRFQVDPNLYSKIFLLVVGGCDPNCSINAKYYQKLTLLAFKIDVYAQVFFVKSPTDKVKANLLVCSDCLLYTPTNEHFGIVPLEAMAGGTPVIACNSGGPRETIEHGVTGFLCDPDPVEMATYMCKIATDKKKAKEMGQTAKCYSQERFSYDKFKKETMTVVEDLVTNEGVWKEFSGCENGIDAFYKKFNTTAET